MLNPDGWVGPGSASIGRPRRPKARRKQIGESEHEERDVTTTPTVNVAELDDKVMRMYRDVATNPGGAFHFEMGRGLAERLGYPAEILDQVPSGAVESFAGVGYHFDFAELHPGDQVADLGSGSGMDAFFAAIKVGAEGRVSGVDMTDEQLAKANRLRNEQGLSTVTFVKGRIEELPFPDSSFDCVVSNGVINLSARKADVFREAWRVLRPGGRLALSDIVTERQLSEAIVCNTDLWASCIGGAAQVDDYRGAVEEAGFHIKDIRENAEYRFLSDQAQGATATYGVKSVSLIAERL
jgi:arsenite methyltransferase